jgi:hypothetical protein
VGMSPQAQWNLIHGLMAESSLYALVFVHGSTPCRL